MNKLKGYGEEKHTPSNSVTCDITKATLFLTDMNRQVNMLCGLFQGTFAYRILRNRFLFGGFNVSGDGN